MVRRSADERDQRFRDRYVGGVADAELRLERAVLGTDVGATGWTTREQADELRGRLDLGPGDRLLDLGTGRGWPGPYLASTTGCEVVLVDQPLDGLRHAVDRAQQERIADRCVAVASTARAPCRSSPPRSTPSHTPTCCVDWTRSSPC